MITQKFALIIIYPHGKDLETGDVRQWLDGAIGKVAREQRVVIETFGDYSYGRIFKGYIEVSRAASISEKNLRKYLETESDGKFQFKEVQKQ